MIEKIAIIDLDSVAFSIGNPNKVLDEFGIPKRTEDNKRFIYTDKTEEELLESMDFIMNSILRNGEFTGYIGYIKGSNTIKYKKDINPNYKSNRPKEKPLWWDFVKSNLIDKWKAIEVNNIEVDDACNITRYAIKDSYLCCIDSDLLGLEGTHFNWRKNEWITVTKEQEELKFWYEMIIGSHNNVVGLKGKGVKFADELFKSNKILDLTSYYQLVLEAYHKHFKDFNLALDEFYINYKLLKVLKDKMYFDINKISINLVEDKVV
jgi:hypothetical protein